MSRLIRASLWSGAIMAFGWGIMTYTTPNEEEFYNRLSPDLKRKVDAARADRTGVTSRQSEALEKLKASASEEKPIWQQHPNDKKV